MTNLGNSEISIVYSFDLEEIFQKFLQKLTKASSIFGTYGL
jgi:hypothetical protein